jgi:8-oxo-dGTP pyrophosphatase MutT (NUDIX family)
MSLDKLPVPALKVANTVRQVYWHLARPYTFAAGVAVREMSEGRLLLVQQTYGNKDMWSLPGGGIGWLATRRQVPEYRDFGVRDYFCFEDTAEKELAQKVGLRAKDTVMGLRYLTTSTHDTGANKDVFTVFGAEVISPLARVASREIARIEWFDLNNMPDNIHHAVEAVLPVLDPIHNQV